LIDATATATGTGTGTATGTTRDVDELAAMTKYGKTRGRCARD
jgi:hypothetical protein